MELFITLVLFAALWFRFSGRLKVQADRVARLETALDDLSVALQRIERATQGHDAAPGTQVQPRPLVATSRWSLPPEPPMTESPAAGLPVETLSAPSPGAGEAAESSAIARHDFPAAEMPPPLAEEPEIAKLDTPAAHVTDEEGPQPAVTVATAAVEARPEGVDSQRDLERRLGTNWFVWIGGLALALAGIFLVRYIAEQGWLSPALRCGIGVAFGASLVIAGEAIRRRPLERAIAAIRPDYVPQALTAAGLVTAFGSTYLAYAFYSLLPQGLSFGLLAAIALAGFALSIVQGRLVALLGLAGAVAIPALVSTDDPGNWGFFTYLGVVVLATQGVAYRKRWYWLPQLSLVATGGWAALWISRAYSDADIVPIGATAGAVALGGLVLAAFAPGSGTQTEGAAPTTRIEEADAVAWIGLVLAATSALVLAIMSGFAPVAHGLMLCLALAAVAVAWVLPRFGLVLPGIALVAAASFALVYLDETAILNLAERLMGSPAPTVYLVDSYYRFGLHSLLIAAVLFWGGVWALRRAIEPMTVALPTGTLPLVLLVIGYAEFRHFSGDGVWVLGATASLGSLVLATAWLRRAMPESVRLHSTYAALAVIAALMALTFQFDRIWLTLGYAVLVLAVSIVAMRVDYPSLRPLVNLIVFLVLVRLTVNPDLRGYEILHPLGMQWVIYGYLVPLGLFVASAQILRRVRDDLTVTVLEGGALLLGVVFVSIEIRIFMTGAIYSGEYRLPEASLQTIVWLTSALILARRNLLYPRVFSTWGARLLTLAGGLQAMVVQLLWMNPVFTGDLIDGFGLFNLLILSLLAPAVLLWLIAGSLFAPGDGDRGYARWVKGVLHACAGILAFAFVTEETRVFFQGMAIRPEAASLEELYATTLAWMLPAALPWLVLADRASDAMRRVALAAILFSLAFLLVGHAGLFNPAFTGEAVRGWPVANVLVLGFILPALLLYALGVRQRSWRRRALVAGSYALVFIWAWLVIKNAFQGARMVALHDSLPELYATTLAWMLLGGAPFVLRPIAALQDARQAGYAVLGISAAMLFLGHCVLFNPIFDGSFVAGWPIFNMLVPGFIIPAAILGLLVGRLDPPMRPVARIMAYLLLFAGVTMLVKHAFQGAIMVPQTLSDIEDYGYSAVWLVLALGTMAAGIARHDSKLRYASLGVLVLVVLKVFLLDMATLAGLWRVASFFGLGISLVGIGYLYQHFIYAPPEQPNREPQATPPLQET